jgi:hypothetical protein
MTVEMEANGDSRSTYERDPSLVGSLDSSYFCPALAALVGPVKNIFFTRRTLFVSLQLSPSPGKLDRWTDSRAASPFSKYVSLGRSLSLCARKEILN